MQPNFICNLHDTETSGKARVFEVKFLVVWHAKSRGSGNPLQDPGAQPNWGLTQNPQEFATIFENEMLNFFVLHIPGRPITGDHQKLGNLTCHLALSMRQLGGSARVFDNQATDSETAQWDGIQG